MYPPAAMHSKRQRSVWLLHEARIRSKFQSPKETQGAIRVRRTGPREKALRKLFVSQHAHMPYRGLSFS